MTNSPKNAPKNGNKIMVNGPRKEVKIPATKPIIAPQTAHLLAPNRFVPQMGSKYSKATIVSTKPLNKTN